MELDPQLHDDNASFASSHSLPNSEDIDDLRLGAEANTLSPESENSKGKNATINSFLILRRGHSLDEEDSFFTFSTISSISDLIDAREGDPEDLLFQLGFTHLEGAKSHSSILSRFNTALDARTTTSGSPDRQHREISYDARDGIVKAQEWLNRQQSDHDSAQFPYFAKDMLQSYKTNASGVGRKIVAQKKRLKWSKSRQSSFEHLLPNLQEESAVEVQESENGLAKEESTIRPIRESSTEKEPCSPEVSEVKDILHALADPSLRHLSATKCSNLINMKVDSFELEEVVSNDGIVVPGRTVANASVIENTSPDVDPVDEEQSACDHCKPPSSVGSVDSSSGFDEGPDDLKSAAEQSPKVSVIRSEKMEWCPGESSGDAYADSMKFNELSISTCNDTDAVRVSPVTCSCSNKRNPSTLLTSSENLYSSDCRRVCTENLPTETESFDGGSKQSDIHTSVASISSVPSMQDLSRKPKLHSPTTSKSFASLNSNFNNSVEDSMSRKAKSNLCRAHHAYSSMPSMHSNGFSKNQTGDCEFLNLNRRKVTSSSSLMTSIADVAYLSYRRFLNEKRNTLESGRNILRQECHKSDAIQNSTLSSQ